MPPYDSLFPPSQKKGNKCSEFNLRTLQRDSNRPVQMYGNKGEWFLEREREPSKSRLQKYYKCVDKSKSIFSGPFAFKVFWVVGHGVRVRCLKWKMECRVNLRDMLYFVRRTCMQIKQNTWKRTWWRVSQNAPPKRNLMQSEGDLPYKPTSKTRLTSLTCEPARSSRTGIKSRSSLSWASENQLLIGTACWGWKI